MNFCLYFQVPSLAVQKPQDMQLLNITNMIKAFRLNDIPNDNQYTGPLVIDQQLFNKSSNVSVIYDLLVYKYIITCVKRKQVVETCHN